MAYFQSLEKIVESLEVDPLTKDDPIKRTFVVNGEYLTANVAIVRDSGNSLHTQADHDEILVIVDGGVDFRVGDEIKEVNSGDLVFIPKNTIHGPIVKEGQSFVALSVFGPKFDPSKKNIVWDRED